MSSARRRRAQQGSRQQKKRQRGADPRQRGPSRDATPPTPSPSPFRVFSVPLALALLSFLPRVSGNPILARSFWDAATVLPFWQQACEEGRRNACDRLIQLESSYCTDNSGWACNELGGHFMEGRITDPDPELATAYFSRACEHGWTFACEGGSQSL